MAGSGEGYKHEDAPLEDWLCGVSKHFAPLSSIQGRGESLFCPIRELLKLQSIPRPVQPLMHLQKGNLQKEAKENPLYSLLPWFLRIIVPSMYSGNLAILRCPACLSTKPLSLDKVFHTASDGEIVTAILSCTSCRRWFRVQEGIADLVRDGLRELEEEFQFLKANGSPMPLVEYESSTPADERIIEEGRHWGRFMRRFWDVGDRSIFDIRVKGTHPSFYVAGVLEPDDRDRYRRWGNFPERAGNAAFLWLGELKGQRGLDIGCSGGQFGLEAAQQGIEMLGFDPSFEELVLARRHAREIGVTNIDYVRGEPANPPFRPHSFHLLMAKDSLHHVPELEQVFPRLLSLLTNKGWFVCHEHIGKPRLKGALMARLMPPAVSKIRSRYPKVEIPGELLRDSANEDVSSHLIEPLLKQYFERIHSVDSLFLADDLEMMAHYAFGKRRWVSAPVLALGRLIEPLFLLLGDRQHLTFHGRLREVVCAPDFRL